MNGNNKSGNKFLSAALTPKSIAILLVFSFMVTVLAFGVAYNEHQKLTTLAEKYDEAIVKINNCEAVLTALVEQMENESVNDVIIPPAEEDTAPEIPTAPEEYVTPTGENADVTKNEAPAPEINESQKVTQATTSKAPSTSGPYFVTQSGKKYHVASCSYLSKSKIPISVDRIKAEGYSPCSRCIK